ncbi:hypothetical protein [Planobispora takensis]|uniref:Uncharacterized protein n=1 Tax=Planobispora takensis TaxID=1367882 RepID=A0A8J3WX22_9ACTN|nr:hypothetical protein [Planobispora takensis]GII04433.1 hypothetical protein Pta02_64410 [Planobispora takensis]
MPVHVLAGHLVIVTAPLTALPALWAEQAGSGLYEPGGARPHIPVSRRAAPESFEAVAPHHPVFRVHPNP